MKVISVPLSQEAAQRLDRDTCKKDDLIEVVLNDDDYETLWESGVLDELNNKLGTMIDDFEDDVISTEQLSLAQEVVIDHKKMLPNAKVLLSLENQIKLAAQKNTGVYFFF